MCVELIIITLSLSLQFIILSASVETVAFWWFLALFILSPTMPCLASLHLTCVYVFMNHYGILLLFVYVQAPRLAAQDAFVRCLGNICKKLQQHSTKELKSK